MHPPILLSDYDIAETIRQVGLDAYMDTLIEKLEQAFAGYHKKVYSIPARDGFRYSDPCTGLIEWMPLMQCRQSVLMKMVGYHPDNPSVYGQPTILSSLSLFDVQSGQIKALADGTLLTSLRTGAASAVASKLMADPESSILGLIGAGAQAVTQLHALSRVFPLEQVLIYDTDPAVSTSFAERVAPLQLNAIQIKSVSLDQVVNQADILCTATSVAIGAGPVFAPQTSLKPSIHINAIGSDLPGKTELPLETLKNSFVCPDFLDQAMAEGECQQLSADPQLGKQIIGPELHELVQNPGKFKFLQQKVTVFDSTGFALEDHVAMEHLLQQARIFGLGTPLEWETTCKDPYNPYEIVFSKSAKHEFFLDPRTNRTQAVCD